MEENIESAKHINLDLAAYFFKHNVAQVTNDATNFLAYCFRVLEKTGDYIWNKKIELTKDKHGSIESDMEIRHYIYKYVQKGVYSLYRHRWNTRIFPVAKISYPMKIRFLSFTCEDITVVVATQPLKFIKILCLIVIIFRIHINANLLNFSTKIRMCVRSIFY